MRKYICFLVFALTACSNPAPALSVQQQLDQKLAAEGTSCAEITKHDPDTPAPDCQKLYDAFIRGRIRVLRRYPKASQIKLGALNLYRPKLVWVETSNCSEYPCIDVGTPDDPDIVRGQTSAGLPYVQYAYEEIMEHETTHALTQLLDPVAARTPEAIAADPGQDGTPSTYIYQITCHNTVDDFAGDGPAGKHDGCIMPYSGPPNPLLGAQQ